VTRPRTTGVNRAALEVGIPADVAAVVMAAVAAGHPRPVFELEFAPPRKWRFDAAWPAYMVALEREGLGGGRHQRFHGYTADCEKYTEAALLGWMLVRATAAQLKSGAAVGWVLRALEARKPG
jgi:hypothetical protein